MTAKEWLMRARRSQERIENLEEQCIQLRTIAQRIVTSYSLSGVKTSGGEDRMGEYTARILDLQGKIRHELEKQIVIREEIMRAIGKLEDIREQNILEYYFLCAMSFEQIAERMNYSRRQIFYIYKRALQKIALYCT